MLPDLRTISAGGRTLGYREAGAGPVLLLLHGIGSGSASWEGQFGPLGERYRVIAWDAPGYGGSEGLSGEAPPVSDYGRAAGDLIDALAIEKVHLVGHSLGALVGAAFCSLFPSRLLTVTLADPAGGYANASEEMRIGRLEARLEALDTLGPAGMAKRRARDVLSPNASVGAVDKVRDVMSRLRPDGYRQAARMLHGSDIYANAATIKVPAMVFCGSADTVTPEASSRRIAEAIPGAAYRTLEGLGHIGYVEDPAAFNTALLDFVDRHA